jgi:choline dehydrogenase-like flavoprotein
MCRAVEVFTFPWAGSSSTGVVADAFDAYITLLSPSSSTRLLVQPDSSATSGSKVAPQSFSDMYLATPSDVTAITYGAKTTISAMLAAHPDIQVLLPTCGGAACAAGQAPSDADIAALVNSYTDSHLVANHFGSTCALGACASTDDAAVLSVANLHVADASLMPAQPAAHPVLTLLAMAIKVARLVAGK